MRILWIASIAVVLLTTPGVRAAAPESEKKPPDRTGAPSQDQGAASQALALPAGDASFAGVPARDAIKALHDASTTNFFVDAAALKAAGIDDDARVTVKKSKDATIGSVLAAVLEQLGKGEDGETAAGFAASDNLVIVSTATRAKTLAKEQRDLARRGNEFERTFLRRALPEAAFDGVGLSDVLQFIQDVTGTRIQPDWKELKAAGVEREAPVSIRTRDLTVAQTMHLVLAAAGPTEPLDFSMRGGNQMIVTRRAVLDKELE